MVFWTIDDVKRSTEGPDNEETGGENASSILTSLYRVWNVQQCELPQGVLEKLPKIETHEHDPIEAAERIINDMPTGRRYNAEAQRPSLVRSPIALHYRPASFFASAEEYYATALHEAVHYADFRIRPRIPKLPLKLCPTGSGYRHNSIVHFLASNVRRAIECRRSSLPC